jgi:predicted Zn finger-like uncharacterized protein
MYTQCPICDTLFTLSIAQLKAAQGKTRCGNCQVVFNALLNLSEELPQLPTVAEKITAVQPADNPQQEMDATSDPPTLTSAELPGETASFDFSFIDEPATQGAPPQDSTLNPAPALSAEERWLATHVLRDSVTAPPHWTPSQKTEFLVSDTDLRGLGLSGTDEAITPIAAVPQIGNEEPAPHREHPTILPLALVPDSTIPPQERAITTPRLAPVNRGVPPRITPDRLTSPNRRTAPQLDDTKVISPHVLQDYARQRIKTFTWQNTLAWSLGVLGLLLLLVIQAIYYMRADLAQFPALRPALETLCSVLRCEVPLTRDFTKIELLARDVRIHPTASDAYLVNVTLINRAAFPQPYPELQLTLANLNETVVAQRRFQPAEYLGPSTDIARGMTPGNPVPILLEVAKPSIAFLLVSWEFKLL